MLTIKPGNPQHQRKRQKKQKRPSQILQALRALWASWRYGRLRIVLLHGLVEFDATGGVAMAIGAALACLALLWAARFYGLC